MEPGAVEVFDKATDFPAGAAGAWYTRRALAVCARCPLPVRDLCLEDALATADVAGVRGGMPGVARERIVRARRRYRYNRRPGTVTFLDDEGVANAAATRVRWEPVMPQVRAGLAAGMSVSAVARELGLCRSALQKRLKGEVWWNEDIPA